MQADPESPVFHIGVARELTGLSRRQTRYYDQVGLVSPKRTEGGTRMCSENDMAELKRIKEMMKWGLRRSRSSCYARYARRNACRPAISAPRV